jgi:DNA-3-methyladenine glycosylase
MTGRRAGSLLKRSFFLRPAPIVAQDLLNKVLAGADGRSGRIVEVEAYVAATDPAAHGFGGKTARNAVMFGPPGHMYVYRIYGIYWCCNCVCGPKGDASGVLIRALEPLTGLERMRASRGNVLRDRDLCRGPGRLTDALGITGAQNGLDLVDATEDFTIRNDAVPPPAHAIGSPRVGISKGTDLLWRWRVPNSVYTSGSSQD